MTSYEGLQIQYDYDYVMIKLVNKNIERGKLGLGAPYEIFGDFAFYSLQKNDIMKGEKFEAILGSKSPFLMWCLDFHAAFWFYYFFNSQGQFREY